jgi:group I intron endonuclease
MAYVYRHIRTDKNQPFYIGIGTDKKYYRAYSSTKRNPLWNNIVKNSAYEVEIFMDDLTWEQACEKEKELISLYGRKNTNTGILCNMTDGGEGTLNIQFSQERRKSISIRNLGNTYGSLTKGRTHTEDARRKMSFAVQGEKHPLFGKKHSDYSKIKISQNKGCKEFDVFKNDIYIGRYIAKSLCAKDLNICRDSVMKGLKNNKIVKGYKFQYT